MKRKIGYAVVGLGVGCAHVDGVKNSTHGTLVAVCDLLQEKLDKIIEKSPDTLAYTNFDEMLTNPDIDIVSIALPSSMHAEYAIRAMEGGKHVLIEKPMDITVEQASKIDTVRIKTGKKVGIVHQNRNNASMIPMKAAIEVGRIGKIFLGNFAVKWYREQEYYDNGGWRGTWDMDGGGSLMNQAVHTIDLMQWLMGDVESVTSTMNICDHTIETEDLTVSIIKFTNGATATFVSTTCAYPEICTDIQIYGTGGSMEADGENLKLWKFKDAPESEEKEMFEKYGTSAGAVSSLTVFNGHNYVVEDMINAIYEDRNPQIVPSDGIKAVKIVTAMYESAKTNKTVYIN